MLSIKNKNMMETNVQNPVPKAIWSTLGVLAIVFLALAVVDKAHNLSQSLNARPQNTISMSADGKASGTPDLATINIGVTSAASTAKAAQDDMSKKVNSITDFIKQQGVDPKDITTANFTVYPTYDYANGKNTITGYQGSESVSVKVRGVDKSTAKVSKILEGAANLGSNQIQGVNFTFDDPDNLKQVARKQALDKAKQKAQELANEAGLKLGKVVSISDSSSSPGYPVPFALDAKVGLGGAPTSSPSIEQGSQDITATVTVVFEIK